MTRSPVIAIACIVMATTPAAGADIDYCRPYAARATQDLIDRMNSAATIKYIWNRFASTCGNDESGGNPVPPASWQDAIKVVIPEPTVVPSEDGLPPGSVPATDPADATAAPTPEPRPSTAAPRIGRSGYAVGSAAWIKWCARSFPRSFDRRTETVVLPGRYGKRVKCPG